MPKIAIDIVLLPDRAMTDHAVALSSKLSKKFNDKILLNKETCLPHISLAMGVIESGDMPEVIKIIQDIGSRFHIFNLTAKSFKGEKIPSGDIVSQFVVEISAELQSLHEVVINSLSSFLSYDVSTDMLFSPPPVEEISLFWIKNYAAKSSFRNFNPHITIGFGELAGVKTPVEFTASRIAVCHLGNYCTCRKVLFSVALLE